MQNSEPLLSAMDELTQLQLKIARRADELSRLADGCHPDCDYWREAEHEICSDQFGVCE